MADKAVSDGGRGRGAERLHERRRRWDSSGGDGAATRGWAAHFAALRLCAALLAARVNTRMEHMHATRMVDDDACTVRASLGGGRERRDSARGRFAISASPIVSESLAHLLLSWTHVCAHATGWMMMIQLLIETSRTCVFQLHSHCAVAGCCCRGYLGGRASR